MPIYTNAKRGRKYLDTPVFYAGSSDDEEGSVVFTDRESANQYINNAGWFDHEIGELTSLQQLQLMMRTRADGTRFLVVNPVRTDHVDGKLQVVIAIEDRLNDVAKSTSCDVLGKSAI